MSVRGFVGGSCGRRAWEVDATFVFEEIAHACATRQNQLGHILNDLGFLLGRESSEPFGQALEVREKSQSA